MSTSEYILDILLMHLDEKDCRHSIRDIVGEIIEIRVGTEVYQTRNQPSSLGFQQDGNTNARDVDKWQLNK
jgi:hypothetical protein